MSNSTFLPIGTILSNQYEIIEPISSGGFGKTYKVKDLMGNIYVVKEFFMKELCSRNNTNNSVQITRTGDESHDNDSEELFNNQCDKFKKEAIKLNKLAHPNIVKVLALFPQNGTFYYVMDYVEGMSLYDKCFKEKLSECKVYHYFNQLLDAVEYIHNKGITHLDIKPANIMIDCDDNVVLIDFGASKIFNSLSQNKTMLTIGFAPFTPGYAPAEQENGNVKYMGPWSDIYALGATLYFLYVGKSPERPYEFKRQLLENKLPQVLYNSPLLNIIKQTMAYEKEDRIKSVAQLREELCKIKSLNKGETQDIQNGIKYENGFDFLPIGSILNGKYKIVCHYAKGGFHNLYLAEDQLGHKKMIKELFINTMCARNALNKVEIFIKEKHIFNSFRDAFEEKVKIVNSLSHQNIVKIESLFEENDTVYSVRNYIVGESLNIKRTKEEFSESKIRNYMNQMLDVLEYIHKKGVVHLDLKPSNIVVDNHDNVFLIDFTSSKILNRNLYIDESVLFTPGYAPIEQECGIIGDLGTHCDIYALAATLYNLLCGMHPPKPIEIYKKGLPIIPNVSHSLWQVIKQSMEYDFNDRIKTVAEFRAMLESGTKQIAEVTQINKPSKIESFVEVVNGVTFKMIKVEGGTFKMGAQSTDPNGENYDSESDSDERPIHSVTLNDYYIGETEVTQELWEVVMGTNPSWFKGSYKPVENVSWNDCQEFITKLNRLTGKEFRLPTEAEWEYAARGGNKSRGYKYAGSNTIGDVAWYGDNAYDVGESSPAYGTHPVGTKSPNELGLYDMSGNVYEWCSDWHGEYSSSSQTNPTGSTSGPYRVLRGGSWYDYGAQYCRVSYRSINNPDDSDDYFGFRLALRP